MVLVSVGCSGSVTSMVSSVSSVGGGLVPSVDTGVVGSVAVEDIEETSSLRVVFCCDVMGSGDVGRGAPCPVESTQITAAAMSTSAAEDSMTGSLNFFINSVSLRNLSLFLKDDMGSASLLWDTQLCPFANGFAGAAQCFDKIALYRDFTTGRR